MDQGNLAPPPAAGRPEQMRAAMAEFIAAVHQAYLAQAGLLAPADRARLPLLAARRLNVAAAGARNLHVVATTEAFPAPAGQEVEVAGQAGDLGWRVRFFDPVVLPALGLVDESARPAPEEVRRCLGVRTYLYHLVVEPGSQLTPHHASHAGAGLAGAHGAAARDLEAIRARAPGRQELVDELAGATVAGLRHAQALLAQAIAPGDEGVAAAAAAPEPQPEAVRAALIRALGGAPLPGPRGRGPGNPGEGSGEPGTGAPMGQEVPR